MAARSPFPGMDPYLETRWDDVHARLCVYISEVLQQQLPIGLRARTEARIVLEDNGEIAAHFRPDAIVTETKFVESRGPVGANSVAVMEPILIEQLDIDLEDRWVQIIDSANNNRVITVIEVLSPGNKIAGRLNTLYRQKVQRYLEAEINFVEIDLLRGERFGLLIGHDTIPAERHQPYFICAHRSQFPHRWEVYRLGLRARLPAIAVPLREADADAVLDLQPLIERVYVAGGHNDIDYSVPLSPPLSEDDAKWALSLCTLPN